MLLLFASPRSVALHRCGTFGHAAAPRRSGPSLTRDPGGGALMRGESVSIWAPSHANCAFKRRRTSEERGSPEDPGPSEVTSSSDPAPSLTW